MVDRKKTVVGRKHAALENMYKRFLVGLSPTCPNTRAATDQDEKVCDKTPDAEQPQEIERTVDESEAQAAEEAQQRNEERL